MSVEEIKVIPAIAVSYTVDVGKGKNLVFQTHIGADVAQAQLDGMLDLLATAGTRQFLMHEREEMVFRLTHFKRLLPKAVEDFAKIDERHANAWATGARKGEMRLTAQQESERAAAQNNIKNMVAEIEALEARLAEADVKIGSSTSSKAA